MKRNFSSYTKKDNKTHGFTSGKMNGVVTFYRVNGVKHAFLRTSQVLIGGVADKLHTKVVQADKSSGYSESLTTGRSRKKNTNGK